VSDEQQQVLEAEREGSRWLYAPPKPADVVEWFRTVPLHEGMDHDRYFNGIVLIPQTTKRELTKLNAQGLPYGIEVEFPSYAPYVQISTRVAYFWDMVRVMNEEWRKRHWGQQVGDAFYGVIEPVPQKIITDRNDSFRNDMLPEGFGAYAVRHRDPEKATRYVTATWEAAIYERQQYAKKLKGEDAVAVLRGIGTKQTGTLTRGGWADDSSLMKAQTGAIGRALGVAGILVVGTGVASAEDMLEAINEPPGSGGSTEAPLPPVVDREGAPIESGAPAAESAQEAPQQAQAAPQPPKTDEELRAHAIALQKEMQADHPDAWQSYADWYSKDREFPALPQLSGAALKGAVTKLERDLDEAMSNVGTVVLSYDDIPPSANRTNPMGGAAAAGNYAREKSRWEGVITMLFMAHHIPRNLERVEAEVEFRWPTNHRRDIGNFKGMLEKAMGDGLVKAGWLKDDDTDRFDVVKFTRAKENGPKRTQIMVKYTT
jgi:hypothetical protein